MPIGQVFFAQREEATLRDATDAERASRLQAAEEFFRAKAGVRLRTRTACEYSPHYLRTSRELETAAAAPAQGFAAGRGR